ncbi:hypothetical protein V6N11_060384 [Hibiscus sabdariffa]|uniref:RNase H type-1 domain-containing protein n=1 Tax=Hibiscus sabdariffa TaxID=183260 RepID=A0ABR2QQ59_9ROSI
MQHALTKTMGSTMSDARPRIGISRWLPHCLDWIKLNTAGAVSIGSSKASCGEVIRDHTSYWILGFSKFIGVYSALEAELWGIYIGLSLAYELGYRRLEVELDNLNAINLAKGLSVKQNSPTIVLYIHESCGQS